MIPETDLRKVTDAMNKFFAERLFQDLPLENVVLLWQYAHEPDRLSIYGKFMAQGILASLHKKIIAWLEGVSK